MDKRNKVLICSYSRSPTDTTAYKVCEVLGLVLLIDKSTDTILRAEPTWSTSLGREFLNDMLRDENIRDVDNLVKLLEESYFGRPKKAIINALISCCNIYDERFTNKDNIERKTPFAKTGLDCKAEHKKAEK